MKNFYTFIVSFGFMLIQSVNAQIYSTQDLDGNNTNVTLSNGGVLFTNKATSSPGFEYPKGSNKHLMYANSFWFGATDLFGSIKMCANTYNYGNDTFKGPYEADFPAGQPNNPDKYEHAMWTISRSEIDYHLLNHTATDYIMAESIQLWPAHGYTEDGEAELLAPFIDVNDNGLYDPENGDYPDVRGDLCTYIILNDQAGFHMSDKYPLGIEMHYMIYQYTDEDGFLDETTFLNLRVYNRGATVYPQLYVGSFLDFDLGDYADDYVGCDSLRNLGYVYNATNSDADYTENPPAFGMVNLNKNMGAFVSFKDATDPTWGIPAFSAEYYNALQGKSKTGTMLTHGGTPGGYSSPLQYNGFPDSLGHWSEINSGNLAGDRRVLMTAEPEYFAPGDVICYDYAYVIFDENLDHIDNVKGLHERTDEVQDWYDEQWRFNCDQFTTLGIEDDFEMISIYPNPSSNGFLIDSEVNGTYEIFDVSGQKVMSSDYKLGEIIGQGLVPGVYIIHIVSQGSHFQEKLIVN